MFPQNKWNFNQTCLFVFNEFKAKYLWTIKHSVAMVTCHMNSNLQENSLKIRQISIMTRYKKSFNLFLARSSCSFYQLNMTKEWFLTQKQTFDLFKYFRLQRRWYQWLKRLKSHLLLHFCGDHKITVPLSRLLPLNSIDLKWCIWE